jgi:hypothetical protein
MSALRMLNAVALSSFALTGCASGDAGPPPKTPILGQGDIGTFGGGRTGGIDGTPYSTTWLWAASAFPAAQEGWALYKVGNPGGFRRFAQGAAGEQYTLQWNGPAADSDPFDPGQVNNFLGFAASAVRFTADPNVQQSDFAYRAMSKTMPSPPPGFLPSPDGILFEHGVYALRQMNHPDPAARTTDVAWVWSRPGPGGWQESWIFRHGVYAPPGAGFALCQFAVTWAAPDPGPAGFIPWVAQNAAYQPAEQDDYSVYAK